MKWKRHRNFWDKSGWLVVLTTLVLIPLIIIILVNYS